MGFAFGGTNSQNFLTLIFVCYLSNLCIAGVSVNGNVAGLVCVWLSPWMYIQHLWKSGFRIPILQTWKKGLLFVDIRLNVSSSTPLIILSKVAFLVPIGCLSHVFQLSIISLCSHFLQVSEWNSKASWLCRLTVRLDFSNWSEKWKRHLRKWIFN